MTHSDQTLQDMFDALQDTYGDFEQDGRRSSGRFEDVPVTVLAAEFADDTGFGDLPEMVQQATALSMSALAA
jgi:hypothetical protein